MEDLDEQENSAFQFSSQDAPPSSPLVPSTSSRSLKPKKPPPITPRRFSRFFGPRNDHASISRSGRELRDITRSADTNSRRRHGPFDDLPGLDSSRKRRKTSPSEAGHDENTSTAHLSDVDALCTSSLRGTDPYDSPPASQEDASDEESHVFYPPRIERAARQHVYPSLPSYAADFWTGPDDRYVFQPDSRGYPIMPFCIAPCSTNSLVAAGDEAGNITLLDAAGDRPCEFSRSYLKFKALRNAAMDLEFSQDDKLLAMAGGDTTARIIHMQTQQTTHILREHHSSPKQVHFQPGNDNIVASSARDGTVAIWDLRCYSNAPRAVLARKAGVPDLMDASSSLKWGNPINIIAGGSFPPSASGVRHGSRSTVQTPTTQRSSTSTTSMSFLSSSRPHLLVTTTDSNAQISLWDIRHRARNSDSIPVSVTAPIASHNARRHWGVVSLALSADQSRVYTVCRDSTVYAYSTAHLALGSSSDALSQRSATSSARPARATAAQGAGPLFGVRHPSFMCSSFYIRCAVRKPTDDKPEMLAVGSGVESPVLFPTDETLLRKQKPIKSELPSMSTAAPGTPTHMKTGRLPTPASSSPLQPGSSSSLLSRSLGASGRSRSLAPSTRPKDDCLDSFPIYSVGTALKNGHMDGVPAVGWTHDGGLVSMADDCTLRLWRENRGTVRGVGGEEFVGRPAPWLRNGGLGAANLGFGFADGDDLRAWDEDDC